MDIRSLISKLDSIQALNEALTLDQVTAAVGQEKSEQKRAKILMGLAQKENLPGLYDPVSGYFVSAMPDRNPMTQQETPRISATASKSSDQKLAQLGLVPQNASTSTFLGRMFRGDQKGQYDLDTKQTSRDARLQQLIADLVGKAGPLLDKLEKKYAAPTSESRFTSGIARALAESIGYNLFEEEAPASSSYTGQAATPAAPAEEDPDLKALQAIMMQLNDISDPKVEPIKDRYAALLQMMDTAKKAAADKEKQAADTKNAQADADALTREGLKKKIARLKELLDKQKAKKGSITPGQNARDDLLARQGSSTDPLARDDATKNALPKGMAIENLSESEIIARLRNRLSELDQKPNDQQVDEFIGQALGAVGNLAKGAVNVGRNFIGGVGGRAAAGTVRTADEIAAAQKATNAARVAAGKKPLTPAQLAQQTKAGIGTVNPATKAARVANTAGKVVRANPVKTALATAAGGAAIGYGLNKDDPKQDVTPVPTPGPVGPAPDPTPTPTPAPDPTPTPAPDPTPTPATPGDDPDMKEIGQLMSDIGQYTNPQEAPADVVDMATKELDAARKALKDLGLDVPAEE